MVDGFAFVDGLERKARLFAGNARATYTENQEVTGWLLDPLAKWAAEAYGEQVFEDAALGYAQYCMHVTKAKRTYEKVGHYTPDDLPEIVAKVYDDATYMTPYMWAAILIYALWPSMISHIELFRDEFLDKLPADPRIIELACGHGVMGLLAVNHRKDATLLGYDIGAPAIDIATRLTNTTDLRDRATFKVQDVLQLPEEAVQTKYQGVMAAMLAEHLTDPRPLFESIADLLAPGGLAYFSTALESPQVDHTYEFNNESEPILMAEKVGLRVRRLVCDAAPARPNDKFSARALAMILEKR